MKFTLLLVALLFSVSCSFLPWGHNSDGYSYSKLSNVKKPKGHNFRTIASSSKKNARKNDIASSYELTNGNFYRYVKGNKCQITNNVTSFKVSQHPNDAAVAYFVRDGDLYVLHNASSSGDCPKTSRKNIMNDVKKYSVIPSTKSTIVNVALKSSGYFNGWDNKNTVLSLIGVADYHVSHCFGSRKSFSTYILFAINHLGTVTKVKNDGSYKTHNGWYNSLDEFKRMAGVCR